DLPDAAPTVFSFGVFGLILMTIMLFFPRGLLPALSDATAATVRGVRRRGATPSAPAAGRRSAGGGARASVREAQTREVPEPAVGRSRREVGAGSGRRFADPTCNRQRGTANRG